LFAARQASTPDLTTVTAAQAFKLHSRPTAARKILLDFDGHITTKTAWNSGRAASIITPAYDVVSDWQLLAAQHRGLVTSELSS
jgi:hypothetical protein